MTVRARAVTVATTQTQLTAADNRGNATAPSYVLVQNAGGASIYIGESDVTDASGVELPTGEREWFVLVQERLFAVCTSGTVACRVLETQR